MYVYVGNDDVVVAFPFIRSNNAIAITNRPSPLGGDWNKDSVVGPGAGFKLTTQHLDEWHAVDTGTELLADAFEVDMSNGIVQDWLVGGI